ncbi:MAG TPA: methyltransferase dimerization domain-containing protein, partial [Tepidiformaceae bacterium]|nr:methyltransferase dimerization domain-containing protein [Tepidiformaceae bacterium]
MSHGDISPSVRLRQLIDGYQVSQAIFVLATLGIPDHLATGPQHVETLAALSGAHAGSLYRLLRALSSVGVLHELDGRLFELTELGDWLRSDSAEPVGHWARYIGRPHFWEAWDHLLDSVQTGRNAFQQLHGGQRVWEWRAQLPEE